MKDKLNERSYQFSIVLNDSSAMLLKNDRFIYNKLINNDVYKINFLAVMLHDKDIDEETNHLKTIHYHIVIEFDCVLRLKTIINLVSDLFHINDNQISIEKCNSLDAQIRYLIHLDDKDKVQYLPFDIISNNDIKVGNALSMIRIRDNQDCVRIVQKFHYKYEEIIMSVVNYKSYNGLIKDLIRMRF